MVAKGLLQAYRGHGCSVAHAVGRKLSGDPNVILLPDDRRAAYRWSGYTRAQRLLRRMADRHPNRGWGFVSRSLRALTHPRVMRDRSRGIEDFNFPGTYSLFDLVDAKPEIVHCHNLHGGFFDLRALRWISARVPTVLTLHDMWLLTGHCAHSIGCDRWKTGCGQCPDLSLYPSIRRDATAKNSRRKRDIYSDSRLHVATPSEWLAERVNQSMLLPAIKSARVIPNGVDLSVFRPADRQLARARLGIPADTKVVLMTVGARASMWKDDRTLLSVIEQVGQSSMALPILCVALGPGTAFPPIDSTIVRSVPYQTDPQVVAQFYQSADLYVHAARAETFPLAVLEAMACGTPVVATNVGGIPEQIRSADIGAVRSGHLEALASATGILVPPADADRMAEAVMALLSNDLARHHLGGNAARDARERFGGNGVSPGWRAAAADTGMRPRGF